MMMLLSGCAYNPTFGDLTCDEEGSSRPGQRCENGVWVLVDQGPEASDSGGSGDVGVVDVGALPDGAMPDASCSAESDTVFCGRMGKDCGDVTGADNCGVSRTATCGACLDTVELCSDNVCSPAPETDEELCAAAGATCDDIMVEDRTGAMRTPNCGTCVAPLGCGDGGTPNTCACANANDAQFCADNAATCGPLTAMDPVCGVERTVNCGACTMPETCGGGGTPNACGCMETDAAFCSRLALNCGTVAANDACGVPRSVSCGTCAMPQSCGGGGAQNVCGCAVSTVCSARGAQCGVIDTSASCDNIATADCGGCGAQGNCQANMCMCNSGFMYNGAVCADINECALNTDMCDANATCTNILGSYTCTCTPPFVGDGFTCAMAGPGPPVVEQVVTDTGTGDSLTTGTMTGVTDQLYVAFVSIRTGTREVDGISGLGLTWTRSGEHCDGNDQQIIEVWTARGTTTGNGAIGVSLSGQPFASAVAVYRLSNVPTNGSRGGVVLRNSNGVNGSCSNSNAQTSYSFTYTPQLLNSLVLVGTAIESAMHTPGANWTEDAEQHRSGGGGNDAGLATMSRVNAAVVPLTVNGTLSSSQNWASAVFEVRGN